MKHYWPLLLIPVGFAVYWYWKKYRAKPKDGLAKQSEQTYTPKEYTAPPAPSITGAPTVTPVAASDFLTAMQKNVTTATRSVANQLTSQVEKKLQTNTAKMKSVLTNLVSGWM